MTRELAFYSMIAGMTGHPYQRLFFVDAKWPLPTPSGLPARVPNVGFHPGRLNRMRRDGNTPIRRPIRNVDSTTLRRCSIDCHSRGHFLAPNSTGSMISPAGEPDERIQRFSSG